MAVDDRLQEESIRIAFIGAHEMLTRDDVARSLKVDLNAIGPSTELLQAGGGLIRELAYDGGIEEGLYFDGSREVQLLGF